jgi:hypothetical protein
MLNVTMLNVIMMNVTMLNVIMLNVTMLNVTMLNVIMLSITMLNVIMLNVIMLNVIMQSVVAPTSQLLPNLKQSCSVPGKSQIQIIKLFFSFQKNVETFHLWLSGKFNKFKIYLLILMYHCLV